MKQIKIDINGSDETSIKVAFDDLMRMVRTGYDNGSGRSSDGTFFSFTASGEYSPQVALEEE